MELDFIKANKLIQERRNQILYGAIFCWKPKPFAMPIQEEIRHPTFSEYKQIDTDLLYKQHFAKILQKLLTRFQHYLIIF